jgi:hypothetical protein
MYGGSTTEAEIEKEAMDDHPLAKVVGRVEMVKPADVQNKNLDPVMQAIQFLDKK